MTVTTFSFVISLIFEVVAASPDWYVKEELSIKPWIVTILSETEDKKPVILKALSRAVAVALASLATPWNEMVVPLILIE